MRLRQQLLTIAQSAGPGKLEGNHLMKLAHVRSTGRVVRVPEGTDHVRPAMSATHSAPGAGYPDTADVNVRY